MHRGANTTDPVPCDCASNGNSTACDDFNLLLGLIVFDHKSQPSLIAGYPEAFQPIIPFLEVFYVPPLFPAKSANRQSFYPAFAAMFGQNSTKMQSASWRSEAYSYTSTTFGTGSIIAISSFSNIQSGVTPDNLQLQDGACADQISTVNFKNFYTNSWGPLVETYYQCTMSFSDAVLNAAGIASGTAGLLVPVGLLCMMYLCIGCGALRMLGSSNTKEVNEKENILVEAREGVENKNKEYEKVEYEEIEDEEVEYEEVEYEEEEEEEEEETNKNVDIEEKKEVESFSEKASPAEENILLYNLVSWIYVSPSVALDEQSTYTDKELIFLKYLRKRQLQIHADKERHGDLSLVEMRIMIIEEFRAIINHK